MPKVQLGEIYVRSLSHRPVGLELNQHIAAFRWSTLIDKRSDALETHYRYILTKLDKSETRLVPIIFRKAQNKTQDPAKLSRLISLVEKETWIDLSLDVKAKSTKACSKGLKRIKEDMRIYRRDL